jgi:anhydro-N-acetylmuramic acid kinase
MDPLRRLLDAPERLVVGLMSGTSADGVDAAVARLAGTGRQLRMEALAFIHRPYDDVLREVLLRNAEAATSSVRELALLDALLARLFAAATRDACTEAGVQLSDLDLIGSHGHTFHHLPEPQALAGEWVTATLQLGDPAALAVQTGVPTVGNFRSADVALGGEGAPLVPYFDWALLADDAETRVLLNLGGIANITVLPAGGDREAVYAFDTGPANMVIDALARRLLGTPYDRDGEAAARGTPDEALLGRLLADPYFERPPPKSTGRERFGVAAVEELIATGAAPDDLLATATAFTVRSLADALERFVLPRHRPDVLIASGGGCRNPTLMRLLAEAVAPVPVRTADDYGVDADAKEALCFAVLAHEFVNGTPTSMPAVTGARRAARLGQLALP